MSVDDHLVELDGLLATTSCQLLRAQLVRCRQHIEGLPASRQYSTSTFVEQPVKASAPISQGKARPTTASLKQRTSTNTVEDLEYTWDQSSKFMKLYLTVPGLTADDHDKVTCSFSDRGVDLRLNNVAGKSYGLVQKDLTHKIKSRDCKYRLKDGCLVLFLWKETLNQYWAEVSSKPCKAFFDHYGRSQLKSFFHEYGQIKISKVCQAENNPLESYMKRLMTSQGYYDITDVASAKAALANFQKSPPTAALVNFGLLKMKRNQSTLLADLMIALATHPCVVMVTCPGFIKPDKLSTDIETLDVLINGRCKLTHFCGRISPSDVGRLPATLFKLGVGVANAEDAAALAKITLPEHLQTFGVAVSRGVKVAELSALPVIKNPYQLFFSDVTDAEVDWVMGCLNKMARQRVCWLHFPNSTLSPSALMLLRDKLFNENWYERHCVEKCFMLFNSMAPFDPQPFLVPPTPTQPLQPTAPMLGLPPVIHFGVVHGVLGVAVDTSRWTESARLYVQEKYRSHGCRLKFDVDWSWSDAL